MRMIQLRHLATIANSNVDKITDPEEIPVRLCNYVDVYKNDRITDDMAFMAASATRTEINKFGLKVGDVIITKDSEDRSDIAVPAYVSKTAPDLVCGYHLALLRGRPRLISGAFLFWALQSKRAREAFSNAAGGVTRFGLTLDGMKSVVLPCPDRKTQEAITDFLDCEITHLNQLIEKKRYFLELISKRIDALVNNAISDPQVPKVRFENVVQRMWRPAIFSDHNKLVPLGLFNRGRGIFKKPAFDKESIGDSKFCFVKQGDLILSGQFAWEGAVAMVTEDENGCVVSHRFPVFRGGKYIKTAYLLGLLRSSFGEFLLNEASRGSAGRNRPLNIRRLGKEKIPIPAVGIQDSIDRALEIECQFKKKTDQSIDLLNQVKAALITAAVTGRIDVATWSKRGQTGRRLDEIEEGCGYDL